MSCASANLWIPNPTPPLEHQAVVQSDRDIPLEIERILFYSHRENQYIVLRDAAAARRLTLVTGYFEANALWWFLKGEPHRRPPTHLAWLNTIRGLGVTLERARVHDRQGDTYFANLCLRRGSEAIEIDVRPSDALLVTLRADVPFHFSERLLALYGTSAPEPA